MAPIESAYVYDFLYSTSIVILVLSCRPAFQRY